MVKREGAGALDKLVRFEVRSVGEDEYGNVTTGPWAEQFREPARLRPLKGSEPVLAQRLVGVQPYVLTVRSSTRTRGVDGAWRAVNARSGAIYDITAITNPDERGAYLDMLVTEGVEA